MRLAASQGLLQPHPAAASCRVVPRVPVHRGEWRCRFYHADPHPGNILRMTDGRLCYLDFGMMGHIDRATRQALIRATLHMVNREFEELANDFVTLGLLPEDSEATVEEVTAALRGAPLAFAPPSLRPIPSEPRQQTAVRLQLPASPVLSRPDYSAAASGAVATAYATTAPPPPPLPCWLPGAEQRRFCYDLRCCRCCCAGLDPRHRKSTVSSPACHQAAGEACDAVGELLAVVLQEGSPQAPRVPQGAYWGRSAERIRYHAGLSSRLARTCMQCVMHAPPQVS